MVSVEFVVRLYDQLCQRITVSGLRIFRAFRHVPYGIAVTAPRMIIRTKARSGLSVP
jgi:hypothetical protein